MENESLIEKLQMLRLWQLQQMNAGDDREGAGQFTEEQLRLMQELINDPNWINMVDDDDDDEEEDENNEEAVQEISSESEDDEFLNNIEKQINAIRSSNVSMEVVEGGRDGDDNPLETQKLTKMRAKHNLDETPIHGAIKNNYLTDTPLKNLDDFKMGNDVLGQEDVETNDEPKRPVAKRPFLRKGEGLTTRFKVPPDAFNLKNLPKYKYASRNAMSLEQKLPNKEKTKDRRSSTGPRLETANRSMRCSKREQNKENEKKKPTLARSKTAPSSLAQIGTKKELQPRENLKRGPTINTSSDRPKGAWATEFEKNMQESPPRSPSQYKILDLSYQEHNRRSEIDELKSFECHERRLSEKPNVGSTMKQFTIDEDDETSYHVPPVAYNHVKFASQVEGIVPLDSDTETVMSEKVDLDAFTSTPNEKLDFAKFRAKLLNGESQNTELSLNPTQMNSADTADDTEDTLQLHKRTLSTRNELMQIHLKELEHEVATYQRENAKLIKMKQEFEIQRNAFEREREDWEARKQDERVQMEVYFHDERMKIKEKMDQLEKKLKESQKPTRKDRDEVIKLNDKISQLEAELKAKEVKHGAAQARLRTQVRALEKQTHEQKLEYDVMKRENKRLEVENVRLRRENNSKMLLEINKNIAKLAHTAPSTPTDQMMKKEITNKASRSVVSAKVVSHHPVKSSKSMSKSLQDKNFRGSCTESEIENGFDDDEEDQFNNNGGSAYFKPRSTTPVQENYKRQSAGNAQNNNDATIPTSDHRKEIVNSDGSKEIYYPNGNLKKISADGMVIRMMYFNKDIKETNIHDGTIKYYYAANNSWETTYVDGKTVLEFADGQTEHRYRDGRLEVNFSNGAKRVVDPSKADISESWTYPDGTKVDVFKNDDKILYLPNGQREIHTKDHKRREFPDGSVKILYNDGSQETRYFNGRIRKRDKEGNLVLDTGAPAE